ncbi:MAG: hypothetical protein ACYSSL_08805 [Planctomycetota bacterium]|jgi:hypothetical protein
MEIMFDDLTPEAQERLLREAGVSEPEDMHWDTCPVAVVEFREDDHEFGEDDFAEDVCDFDYGYDGYLD